MIPAQQDPAVQRRQRGREEVMGGLLEGVGGREGEGTGEKG